MRTTRSATFICLLPLLCACGERGESAGGAPILSSNRRIAAEHRMTPDQLRAMTGVDRLPAPSDKAAFMAALASHYPASHRATGESGSALVDVAIDDAGKVASVEIIQRPTGTNTILVLRERDGTERRVTPQDDPDFGAAAQAALRTVRFTPAMRDGKPVPYTMRMTVTFDPPGR